MKFSFEKPAVVPEQEQMIPVRPGVAEIEEQLERYSSKYEQAIADAAAGDKEARAYLTEVSKNLVEFKNSFDIEHGTLSESNRETYEHINDLQARIKEVLGN